MKYLLVMSSILTATMCCVEVKSQDLEAPKKMKEVQAANATAMTPMVTKKSLKLAINDLIQTMGSNYPDGVAYLKELSVLDPSDQKGLIKLQRKALLANPLLDFNKILVIKSDKLAIPTINAYSNTAIPDR